MSRRTVSVRVFLLPTNGGGRSRPLSSGYRSLLRSEGSDVDFGYEIELEPYALRPHVVRVTREPGSRSFPA